MKSSKIDILSRPLFISSLGILLLNDFYLKYEFSNYLTGKLSDITGLFLFPYFLSSLRIKWAKTIYIGTAALFLFWKSPFSQEVIDLARALGIGFNRVIDYTDLFSLFILPFSFRYFQKQLSTELHIGKYLPMLIGVISLFAIWATTLPREKIDLNLSLSEEYELEMSKANFFESIQVGNNYSDTLEKNLKDSLFYLKFYVPQDQIDVTALAKITAVDSNTTSINLLQITHGHITGGLFTGVNTDDIRNFKSLSDKDFKALFKTHFLKPVKNGSTPSICYFNKDLLDSYQND